MWYSYPRDTSSTGFAFISWMSSPTVVLLLAPLFLRKDDWRDIYSLENGRIPVVPIPRAYRRGVLPVRYVPTPYILLPPPLPVLQSYRISFLFMVVHTPSNEKHARPRAAKQNVSLLSARADPKCLFRGFGPDH